MNWKRIVATIAVAGAALGASGCIPVVEASPTGSFTSPYHGISWQGSANGVSITSPGVTFYGCSDHVGQVTVVLSPPFGGTDTSGGPFTVRIKTPYEDTSEVLDFDQPMTTVSDVHPGDCFQVALSSLEYNPPEHCAYAGQPGCDPSVPLVKWDGADYTISW